MAKIFDFLNTIYDLTNNSIPASNYLLISSRVPTDVKGILRVFFHGLIENDENVASAKKRKTPIRDYSAKTMPFSRLKWLNSIRRNLFQAKTAKKGLVRWGGSTTFPRTTAQLFSAPAVVLAASNSQKTRNRAGRVWTQDTDQNQSLGRQVSGE